MRVACCVLRKELLPFGGSFCLPVSVFTCLLACGVNPLSAWEMYGV